MAAPPSNPGPTQARAAREGACVVGAVPAASLHAGQVGIVLDGVLRHAVAAEPGEGGLAAFSFPLAGLTVPATVDLEELATGRRLLPEPLATADAFTLDELRFDGPALAGAFSLAWAPHPVLPVAFLSGGAPTARGVAEHDPDASADRAVYRFRAPLAVLPAGPLAVLPVVAGASRPEAARTLDCPFAGYVDDIAGPAISGWAAHTLVPGRPVPVEVRRGNRTVAAAVTDRPRPDVARAIPGAELCGFTLTVPLAERMRRTDEPYRVVVAGTDTELRNGVVRIEPAPGRLQHLDGARGGVVSGWALDGAVDGPVPIEVRRDGVVVAAGLADLFRADLAGEGLGAPGLPPGHCAFAIRLPGFALAGSALAGPALAETTLEVLAAGQPMEGSPVAMAPNPNIARFLARREAVRPAVLPRLRAALDRRVGRRSVSLVLAASGVEPEAVSATLASIAGQWCSRWEALCVHDGFAEPAIARVVAQLARRDPRIRMVPAAAAEGPAAFLAAGLAAVRSGYAVLLRPHDRLEPDAVYQLLRAVGETGADVLFTDAGTVAPDTGRLLGMEAQTAFSADRFRAAPFWPDLLCVRTALAQSLPPAAGLAFAAAALEAADKVAHVPAVAVCRPPTAAPAAPLAPASPPAPFKSRLLVLAAAAAAPDWLRELPVKCRTVALGADAGPAAINEAVAREGKGCAGLLLLGPGVARPPEDATARLLALLARPDVAACGPVLLAATGRVAAAGLVLGGPSGVVPGLAGVDPAHTVPPAAAGAAVRNVSALPASFLFVRTDAWAEAGGYDPAFAAGPLCDADLCLRLEATGRAVLLDAAAAVTAPAPAPPDPADLPRFTARHAAVLREGDRWYSPFLDPDGSWLLRGDEGCRTLHSPRVVARAAPAA